ncbi:MAG: hypothetical protein GX458_16615, partial [Phyllobacteriaceae bacterium]|nr:hypothetical protein [Phyllobacteriaceae bacterium]
MTAVGPIDAPPFATSTPIGDGGRRSLAAIVSIALHVAAIGSVFATGRILPEAMGPNAAVVEVELVDAVDAAPSAAAMPASAVEPPDATKREVAAEAAPQSDPTPVYPPVEEDLRTAEIAPVAVTTPAPPVAEPEIVATRESIDPIEAVAAPPPPPPETPAPPSERP